MFLKTESVKPCRNIAIRHTGANIRENRTEKSDNGLSLLSSLSQYTENSDNSDNSDTYHDKAENELTELNRTKKEYPDNYDTILINKNISFLGGVL